MSAYNAGGPYPSNAPSTSTFVTSTNQTSTLPNSRVLTAGANITLNTATPGQLIVSATGGGGGSGTVTSFSAGTLSPLFTTSVANSTTTPALSFSQSTQAANLVFSGPTTGANANPTFRSLVTADLPAGTGNVTGAANSVQHQIVSYADTGGKTLENYTRITVGPNGLNGGTGGINFTISTPDEADPGDMTIIAGNATSGSTAGGNVLINSGAKSGSGTPGYIQLNPSAGGVVYIGDNSTKGFLIVPSATNNLLQSLVGGLIIAAENSSVSFASSDLSDINTLTWNNQVGDIFGQLTCSTTDVIITATSSDSNISLTPTGVGTINLNGIVTAAKSNVVSKTNGVGSPYSVLTTDTSSSFDNNAATAEVYFNLPAAAVGLTYKFTTVDSDGLRVVANGTDTIRVGATVSAAGGHYESLTIGDSITLECHVAGSWFAIASVGSGTIT